jgi:hypothetical protein
MKRMMLGTALFLGALLGATLGFGGGVPNIPSTPTFNEPSQIVSTLNAFINQLNGNPAGQGGYAAQPGNVISLGAACAGSGTTTAVCNGQRGTASFTGIVIAATGTTQTLTITDSNITTASVCNAWWTTAFTAGSNVFPQAYTPMAGSLLILFANAGPTTNAVTTGTLAFNCVN